MKVNRLKITLLSLLSILAGCGDYPQKKAALETYVNEVEQRPTPPIQPLPHFSTYAVFSYNAQNLRDPFAPLQSNPATTVGGPDIHRPKQELEGFALDSLKMMGNLSQGVRMWALILAPNNLLYRAQVGDYIGQNYGKITAITKEKVIITETVPNNLGGWEKRGAVLTLSQ